MSQELRNAIKTGNIDLIKNFIEADAANVNAIYISIDLIMTFISHL